MIQELFGQTLRTESPAVGGKQMGCKWFQRQAGQDRPCADAESATSSMRWRRSAGTLSGPPAEPSPACCGDSATGYFILSTRALRTAPVERIADDRRLALEGVWIGTRSRRAERNDIQFSAPDRRRQDVTRPRLKVVDHGPPLATERARRGRCGLRCAVRCDGKSAVRRAAISCHGRRSRLG